MPYEIDSEYIKVRNAVLLWPRINLQSYTYILDPRRVFIMHDKKFIIEIQFVDYNTILIREQISSPEKLKLQNDRILIDKIKTRSINIEDF